MNVSCGVETLKVVEKIRKKYPDFPIMATGGPTEESIRQVIAAGANAITYTAPSNGELFKGKMKNTVNMQDRLKQSQSCILSFSELQ